MTFPTAGRARISLSPLPAPSGCCFARDGDDEAGRELVLADVTVEHGRIEYDDRPLYWNRVRLSVADRGDVACHGRRVRTVVVGRDDDRHFRLRQPDDHAREPVDAAGVKDPPARGLA